MIREIETSIWDNLSQNCVICILTNNTCYKYSIKEEDFIYSPMEDEIGKQALIRNPSLDYEIAACVKENRYEIFLDKQSQALLFRFPIKESVYDENLNLKIIEKSLQRLFDFSKTHPNLEIRLSNPCYTNGDSEWFNSIKPLCEKVLKDEFELKVYKR